MKIGLPIKPEYYFMACDHYSSIYHRQIDCEIKFILRLKIEEGVIINNIKLIELHIPPEPLNIK